MPQSWFESIDRQVTPAAPRGSWFDSVDRQATPAPPSAQAPAKRSWWERLLPSSVPVAPVAPFGREPDGSLTPDPYARELIQSTPEGLKRMGRGAPKLLTPGQRVEGAADIVGGAMRAATPLLVAGGVAAPLATAAGLGAGVVTSTAASKGLETAGASPAWQEIGGAVAGVVGGAAGAAGARGGSALARLLRLKMPVETAPPRGGDVVDLGTAPAQESAPTAEPPASAQAKPRVRLVSKPGESPRYESAPTAEPPAPAQAKPRVRLVSKPGESPRYESAPAATSLDAIPERPRETPLPPGAVKRTPADAADVQAWATDRPEQLPGHQRIADITKAAERINLGPEDVGTESGRFSSRFVAYAAKRRSAREAYDAAIRTNDPEQVEAASRNLVSARQHEVRMASDFGRNLRVTREQAQQFMTLADDGVDRAIRAGMPEQEVADLLAKAGDDPDAWIRGLKRAEWAHLTALEKLQSVWTASVLSGPATQARNVFGNLMHVMTKPVMTALEAGVDTARVAVKGGERVTTLGEVGAQMRAIPAALKTGAAEAGEILKKGYSTQRGDLSALDTPIPEIRGVLKPLNAVGRLMRAMDALFRTVAHDMEVAGQLHTAKASTPTPSMLQQAETTAARAVFQEKNPVGAFAARAKTVKRNAAGDIVDSPLTRAGRFVLHLVAPFTNTPSNIIRQGLEYSPAGFLMKSATAGADVSQRTANAVMARAVAGTAALAPLWALAASGRLSGRGPSTPSLRAELMESGWRPNSIKIGDTWYSYAPLAHLAIPMTAVANAFESYQKEPDADPVSLVFHTALGSAGSVLNQSYLSQAGALVEALTDPRDPADRAATLLGRMAGGFVPASGLLRTVAQATDPVIRRPQTGSVTETMKANLPGLSRNVEPRMDRFGRPVTRSSNPLNIFQPSRETHDDPVAEALRRAHVRVTPAAPDTEVRVGRADRALNRPDAFALGQNKGQALYALLRPVVERQSFQAAPVERQQDILQRLITRARDQETRRAVSEIRRGQPVRARGQR